MFSQAFPQSGPKMNKQEGARVPKSVKKRYHSEMSGFFQTLDESLDRAVFEPVFRNRDPWPSSRVRGACFVAVSSFHTAAKRVNRDIVVQGQASIRRPCSTSLREFSTCITRLWFIRRTRNRPRDAVTRLNRRKSRGIDEEENRREGKCSREENKRKW